MITDIKPLQPLPHGNILIVGAKASNFDEELRTHPRVILWSSQNEHWTDKDLPTNVRAVFITRWIGHAAFAKLLSEARKRQITMFNPEGTGMIARQVRELLDIHREKSEAEIVEPKPEQQPKQEEPMAQKKPKYNKLLPLHQFVDLSKGNLENARFLMPKAKELGIDTTLGSLSQLVSGMRRKQPKVSRTKTPTTHRHVDVVVEMLDGMINELKDMRAFLIATVEENKALKVRVERFRKALEE